MIVALPDRGPGGAAWAAGTAPRRPTASSPWSIRIRSRRRPTSPVGSSATRTCSSRRSAKGSRSPRPRPSALTSATAADRSGDELHKGSGRRRSAGPPAVTDTDHSGRTMRSGRARPDPRAVALTALAGHGDLVVADGNHRSLAAQIGKLPRFLAVVTTPASVAIQPYHRLVVELAVAVGRAARTAQRSRRNGGSRRRRASHRLGRSCCTGRVARTRSACRAPRVGARSWTAWTTPWSSGSCWATRSGWNRATSGSPMSAGTTRRAGSSAEVDAGRADLAILIAPVTVDEFVAVNLARQKMPRKSTWFTPKARAGWSWRTSRLNDDS